MKLRSQIGHSCYLLGRAFKIAYVIIIIIIIIKRQRAEATNIYSLFLSACKTKPYKYSVTLYLV